VTVIGVPWLRRLTHNGSPPGEPANSVESSEEERPARRRLWLVIDVCLIALVGATLQNYSFGGMKHRPYLLVAELPSPVVVGSRLHLCAGARAASDSGRYVNSPRQTPFNSSYHRVS
jgi:hypothetical protein